MSDTNGNITKPSRPGRYKPDSVLVRLPPGGKSKVAAVAAAKGVSVNALFLGAITKVVGGFEPSSAHIEEEAI